MRIWLALLAAPALALTDESISYAAAGWTCARQDAFVMHAIHVLFLAATLATAVMAWRLWIETRGAGDERTASRHFLAGLGIAVATLASAVIAAMWIPNWLLSPCFA